nr:MAG TPA: tail fiber assembly protein [Caudoviricetes sp.]
MKKFTVDRIEIKQLEDGFKYYGIFDKENKDWYEELKKFDKDTLKVMYNKDTHLVLSTNIDVSMIAPTMAGDVVEEIEYQEVETAPDNYLVDGKIVKLKEYEKIENGKIVFDRDMRIEEIKKELSSLKDKKIRLGVEVKEGVYHPARDTDKINLIIAKTTLVGEQEWKYYDIDGNPVLDKINRKIIDTIIEKGTKVLNGAIIGETKAEEGLSSLSDDDLKTLDIKSHFEKYYKMNGGI